MTITPYGNCSCYVDTYSYWNETKKNHDEYTKKSRATKVRNDEFEAKELRNEDITKWWQNETMTSRNDGTRKLQNEETTKWRNGETTKQKTDIDKTKQKTKRRNYGPIRLSFQCNK